MAAEQRRACGYRKINALYLCSDGGGMPCDRLPIPLTVCPTCSHGFKQSRGFTWVDVAALVGGVHQECKDVYPCPLCMATSQMGKAGMLWIGEVFYPTPKAFDNEAAKLGISRRIHALPRQFKVGETWILLAHPKGIVEACPECHGVGLARENGVVMARRCEACEGKCDVSTPAIFKVWKPSRIEKILPDTMRGSDEAKELEERGITPVFLPSNDPDHRGNIYEDEEEG
jgi:hypothetical protein